MIATRAASMELWRPPRQDDTSANPVVRKLSNLTPLSLEDRAVLTQITAHTQVVVENSDLIDEGEVLDGAFLIVEGVACRYMHRPNGLRRITAFLLPGDICDPDVALLSRMDHALGTLSVCRIAFVSRRDLTALIGRHPRIALALRLHSAVGEAILRRWLVTFGCRSAPESMAHLFCEPSVRFQAVGLATGTSYDLPLTQADLADTLGLSAVHANRTLQKLRQDKLVEFTGKTVLIADEPGLRRLAEFDPRYLQSPSLTLGHAGGDGP